MEIGVNAELASQQEIRHDFNENEEIGGMKKDVREEDEKRFVQDIKEEKEEKKEEKVVNNVKKN